MADLSEQPPTTQSEPPPPIRWRSWPVRDDALQGLAVVTGLLLVAAVVGGVSGKVYLGLLALAALVVALWRFFLPVRFGLDGEGISQRIFGRQRRIPWEAIRHHEVRWAGVLLLPREDRSAMAPFRGLYVPWTAHRDEVLAHVDYYLDRPRQTQEFVAGHGAV